MEVIPRETRKITYSTEIRALKKKLRLSDYQKSIIIGGILGDIHLEPNWSKTNYKLSINQCVKQKSYVMWKYKIFNDWVLTKPKLKIQNNSFGFRTISHGDITELRNIFYQNGKKTIPNDIGKYLKNPVSLAVWFMDDGNAIIRNRKIYGYHLNTQSFDGKDNLKLIRAFKEKFGIKWSCEINHGKCRLRIMQKTERDKFASLIKA